ncbi:MAG: HAMP domain-containing histidine kinase [Pirellulales bacterium]|nr:HAMP domain-containing histidine kinase [Pirellulales bacterium]
MSGVGSMAAGRVDRDSTSCAQQSDRARRELDHLLRALSHDMSANFMLLESAFDRLQQAVQEKADPELVEMAAHVSACLGESKRFLGDLIRLGKTGSVEMEPDRVPLGQVVDEVLFEQQQVLGDREVNLNVDHSLPAVWCNRQRLKQILSNLLRNALRHGCDPAAPRISISAEREPADTSSSGTVRIRVHDNGPGIDRQLADEAFLPGRRLPGAAAEGSGMGLAIVRKIAEHYGGSAWIDPDGPPGTTVVVTLPGVADRPPGADVDYPNLGHDGPHHGEPMHPHQLRSAQPRRRHRRS